MSNLPFRRRHGDPADAPQLDELLDAGRVDATGVVPAPEWQSVSDVLRSAAAATEPSELAGEAAVLAAFRRERAGIRHRRPQPIARCKTMFSTLLTGRIAAGVIAGVVTVTGAATAAYACVLPSPIQNFAHDTIGAPAKSGSTTVSTTDAFVLGENFKDPDRGKQASDPSVVPTVTPSPTATLSPSALALKKAADKKAAVAAITAFQQKIVVYRLCQEYATATAAGKTLDAKGLAILVKAAGSATAIAAYCAALPVLPTTCIHGPFGTVSPSATPTATPTFDQSKHWGPWCGFCPELKATATATAAATATATADPNKDGKDGKDGNGFGHFGFGFWCDNGPGHHFDPKVLPLPTAAVSHDSVNSRDPGHDGFGGNGNSGNNSGNGAFQGHNHK
jgi:hypothetical protein